MKPPHLEHDSAKQNQIGVVRRTLFLILSRTQNLERLKKQTNKQNLGCDQVEEPFNVLKRLGVGTVCHWDKAYISGSEGPVMAKGGFWERRERPGSERLRGRC